MFLTVNQVQNIVYRLMQTHKDGIPVASILHCIEACLNVSVPANENGISLEHLLSCVKGAQIENNVYGIKIIGMAKANEKRPGIDIYDGEQDGTHVKPDRQLTWWWWRHLSICSWRLALLFVQQLHLNAGPVAGERSH